LTFVGGVVWLLTRKPAWEALIVAAAEVGLIAGAMDTEKQRSMTTAVYGILLGPLYPLVSKAIEIGQTAHPRSFSDLLSAPEIGVTKNVATLGVMVAMMSLIALRFYSNRIAQRIAQERVA
jgi:hypothetical protein